MDTVTNTVESFIPKFLNCRRCGYLVWSSSHKCVTPGLLISWYYVINTGFSILPKLGKIHSIIRHPSTIPAEIVHNHHWIQNTLLCHLSFSPKYSEWRSRYATSMWSTDRVCIATPAKIISEAPEFQTQC